jgi:hypothetical protein
VNHDDVKEITFGMADFLSVTALAIAATYWADDWIAGVAIVVLWFIWKYLRLEGGVPVLAAALTFQWIQVTIGVWYYALSGRRLATMELSDYRPMVLIGLGCIAALAVGLRLGIHLVRRTQVSTAVADGVIPLSWLSLAMAYVVTTAAQGGLQAIAYDFPGLTQPILALRFIRLAVLFLVIRRLSRPVLQWHLIAPIVLLEVVLGITGYFAGFREPLVMVVMALYESFNPRKFQHWAVASVMAVLMILLSTMWMSVRIGFRQSFDDETFAGSREMQMDRMAVLASNWWSQPHDSEETDKVVDRLWTIYYPALAVSRVPAYLPHTDGALMMAALTHVFNPRLFFPTKAELQSDSEMVRKYSGVWVAGVEQNTSIAFGYAAEAYLDFGVPWMFLPVLIYGVLMGAGFQYLAGHITYGELRAGALTTIYWLVLYLFERSWVKTLGLAGTLYLFLGGPALLLDYYLSRYERRLHPQTNDDSVKPLHPAVSR